MRRSIVAAFAGFLLSCAPSQGRVQHNPPGMAAPLGGYSHGVEVRAPARVLYISGQIPADVRGEVPKDFDAQCEIVWNNIHQVLKASGMDFEHLVKVTTYLSSREYAGPNSVIRRRVLGNARPALTVLVTQTLDPEWLLEIDAIAVKNTN